VPRGDQCPGNPGLPRGRTNSWGSVIGGVGIYRVSPTGRSAKAMIRVNYKHSRSHAAHEETEGRDASSWGGGDGWRKLRGGPNNPEVGAVGKSAKATVRVSRKRQTLTFPRGPRRLEGVTGGSGSGRLSTPFRRWGSGYISSVSYKKVSRSSHAGKPQIFTFPLGP